MDQPEPVTDRIMVFNTTLTKFQLYHADACKRSNILYIVILILAKNPKENKLSENLIL